MSNVRVGTVDCKDTNSLPDTLLWYFDRLSGKAHRCDKRLQRLQKILCKRVYYFVNVYLNKIT